MKSRKGLLIIVVIVLILTLTACSKDDSLSVRELLNLGNQFLLDQDYEQALAQFLRAIELDPVNPLGYIGAADAYAGLGRLDDAIDILLQGLEQLPNDSGLQAKLDELARGYWCPPQACTWTQATCQAARTCTNCGGTDGSPLAHVPTLANFQEPSICITCGDVVEGPLTPGFVRHGYALNAAIGAELPYRTATYANPSLNTVGVAVYDNFRVFKSDGNLTEVAGYEWQTLRLTMTFTDDNAWRNGAWSIYSWFCYYLFDPGNPVSVSYSELHAADIPGLYFPGLRVANETVNYRGVDYPFYISANWAQSTWAGRTLTQSVDLVFLVPEGYDGIVVSLFNYSNLYSVGAGQAIGDLHDIDSLFFRLR